MQVIGAGVGRTGTLSLRVALEQLGFGPCYHMQVVLGDMDGRTPGWVAALAGHANFGEILAGFNSAVDWPVASFYREMHAAYPQAQFILTHRSPASWVGSFRETIYTALAGKDQAPPPAQRWLGMCEGVIARAGFPLGLDDAQLAAAFAAHNEAVRAAIPAGQLLEFQVREGWQPLCEFLGVDVPDGPFPRTNDRAEFWELVKGGG